MLTFENAQIQGVDGIAEKLVVSDLFLFLPR